MVHPPVSGRGVTLLSATAAAVVLGDWLFYRALIGWTAGGFTLLLTAALLWRAGPKRGSGAWGVAGALAVVALAMVIHPGGLEYALAGVGLAVLAMTGRGGWTASAAGWAGRLAAAAVTGWLTPLRDAAVWNRWRRRHGAGRGNWAGPAAAWGVPVALGLVFVGLLAAANPVIERILGDAVDWFGRLGDYLAADRVGLWLALTAGVWTLLRLRVRRGSEALSDAASSTRPVQAARLIDRVITPGVLVRCLVVFNLIFAVQSAMDALYLWAGSGLPEGITYARYAHRGAYPLLAATLLAGVFVLVTFRGGGSGDRNAADAGGHAAEASAARWARRLVLLWLAQNIALMAASVERLSLYVDVYSLTRLRLAAAIWMGVVAVGLALLIARIARRRDNRWLLQRAAAVAVAVCLAASLVNFDGIIAWYNVRHAPAIAGPGGVEAPRRRLDVDYLEGLGLEAIEPLRWYAREAGIGAKGGDAAAAADRLQARLDQRLRDWRGWTWRAAGVGE